MEAEARESAIGEQSLMTVSPMSRQLVLQPGEVYTGTVTVSNPSWAKMVTKYSVKVGSFSQVQDEDRLENNGVIDTDTVTGYNEMTKWITLDREGGELQPNESQVVTFTIRVPENAPAGGQYASILFQNDSLEADGVTNVNIMNNVQIASLIYAEMAGEVEKRGEILSNDVPGFLLAGPIKASSMVQDDGNVHGEAQYILQVWPLFSDKAICTNENEPNRNAVMPGARVYHVESCVVEPVGIYRVRQTVDILGETSIVEKTVFICPIWLMVLTLMLVVGVGWFIVSQGRARWGRKRGRRP